MTKALQGTAAARLLRDIKMLDRLGWSMSLTTWRVLATAVPISVGVVILVTAHAITLLLISGTLLMGLSPGAIIAAIVALQVYLAVGLAARLLFSAESDTLRSHPDESYFKSVDLPKKSVVSVLVIPRLQMFLVITAAMNTGVVTALANLGRLPSALAVSLPFLTMAAMTAGLTALSFGVCSESRHRRVVWSLVLTVVAGTLAYEFGRRLGELVPAIRGGLIVFPSVVVPDSVVAWTVFGLAGLAAVFTVLAIRRIRVVHDVSWSVEDLDKSPAGPRSRPSLTRIKAPILTSLTMETSRRALARTFRWVWIISAAVTGFAPTLRHFVAGSDEYAHRLTVTVGFLLGLMLSDLMLRYSGPIALGSQMRFAFERGRSAPGLSLEIMAAQTIFAAPALVPIGLAASAAGIDPRGFVLTVFACLWSGLLAAAISGTSRVNDRGQSSGSASSVIIAVMLAVGVVALGLLLPTEIANAAVPCAVLLIGGGAVLCIRQRILRHPLPVEAW